MAVKSRTALFRARSTAINKMKPSFAIVGCGKVGTSLGWFLSKRGYPPAGVAGRHLESARTAADIIGTDIFSDKPWEITGRADIVFITTPDDAIAETCRGIIGQNGLKENSVVLHCSGSLPSTILSTGERSDIHIGSLHPLQSFASIKTDRNPFRDIIAAVEGDETAVQIARGIATDLGAICIEIKTEAKPLYHAAAVVASNYLVSLMDLSFRLIAAAGITGSDAVRVLYPLVKGTLGNIEKIGIPNALTGPISRGDVETVADHLNRMLTEVPELVSIYKSIGRHTVGLAVDKGTLSEEKALELRNLLERD
jgi:predicted short-subunit dehydrogenase-like oxidoreductase (DUF2520 family)